MYAYQPQEHTSVIFSVSIVSEIGAHTTALTQSHYHVVHCSLPPLAYL